MAPRSRAALAVATASQSKNDSTFHERMKRNGRTSEHRLGSPSCAQASTPNRRPASIIASCLLPLLERWWAYYNQWPEKIDGNTLDKKWKPRELFGLYGAVGLVASLYARYRLTLEQGMGRYSQFASLLTICTVLGFMYTNHVTTARRGWLRGKHEDYRDICTVLCLLLPVAYLGMGIGVRGWDMSELLFSPRPESVQLAVEQDVLSAKEGALWGVLELVIGRERIKGWSPFVAQLVSAGYAPQTVYGCLFLCSYWLGLHVPYITRPGYMLSRSLSQKDLATAGLKGGTGIALKLGFVFYWVLEHCMYLAQQDMLLTRLSVYLGIVLCVAGISYSVRDWYYWHLHHWAVGALLTVCCHGTSPGWSMVLQGICLSQLVEGAARWSCAPLWHKLDV